MAGMVFITAVAAGLYQWADVRNDLRDSQLGAQWRLAWVVSALALATALVWTFLIAVQTIQDALTEADARDRRAWRLTITGVGVVLVVSVAMVWRNNPHFGVGTDTTDRFTDLIESCATRNIRALLTIGNVGSVVTLFVVAMACCSLGLPLRAVSLPRIEERFRLYRTMLYSASALLAAGVLEMYALQRWGAAYNANCTANPNPSLAESLAFTMGGFYTLGLVVLFLPVAIVQDGWITQNVLVNNPDPTPSEPSPLPPSPLKSFATLGAMSLPVVTSLATAVAKALLRLKGS